MVIEKDIPLLIIAHDIRSYVLSGNKSPSFVGLTRSLYGIPYPTTTKSGKALADDFTGLILNGMSLKGYSVSTTHIAATDKDEEIYSIIKSYTHESGVTMLFSIREWKTDVHFTASLHYDVKLEIVDKSGKVRATSTQKGVDALRKEQRLERLNLATAFKDIISELISEPDVLVAISSVDKEYEAKISGEPLQSLEPEVGKVKNEPVKTVITKKVEEEKSDGKCTVDQILKMKEIGMIDSQIKAACE